MRSRRFGSFALLACLLASPALAQFPSAPAPAEPADTFDAPAPLNLSYVDGRVDLVRPDGVQAAQAPDLLEEDDRLVTVEGRAELVVDDGSVAHVDRQSDVRIDLGVRLRLVSGRLLIHTAPDIEALYVSTPAGPVRLTARGIYDLSADDLRGDTVIAVREGHAALVAGDSETPIGADDVLHIDPRDLRPRWSRGAPHDAFADWSARRIGLATTAQHAALPAPVQPWAADLAAHGQWSSLPPYGDVWFPSAGPAWRPYQFGSWRFTRYGWTWIDADRWAWPVHHYGRWGHHGARGWYWIPQRAWGPAWVGWAVAANHVAWSPLGWDRRPIVDFSVGARLGPGGLFASSWSILPRQAFGRRGPIYRDLQDPRYLPGPVLGGFVSQMIGPRGPAGPGDRFAARPGRRTMPPPPRPMSGRGAPPPIAYQPRSIDPPQGERLPETPTRRRPMDAPPVDPTPEPAPGAREREWSSAPGGVVPAERGGSRRGPREVAPVGAPVRVPRGEAPPATPSGSGPGERAGRGAAGTAGAGPAAGSARPRGGDSRAGAPNGSPRGRGGAGDGRTNGRAGQSGQGGVRRPG